MFSGDGRLRRGMVPRYAVIIALMGALTTALQAASVVQHPLFDAPLSFSVGTGPDGVAKGDFDKEAHTHIAVANRSRDNLSVFQGGSWA